MSFRDNLQHLRDTQDMSQADLAQQLGVSRQSVAKWEAEKSYPEMDKLIKICDLFDCSLDDLVRGDLAAPDSTELATLEEPAVSEGLAEVDACGYDDHMRRRAWDYAAGVAAVFTGFGVGVNFTYTGPGASPLPFIICFAIGVAVALFFVEPARAAHRAFRQEHPHVDDFYTADQKAEARNAKGGVVVGAVLLVAAGLIVPSLISGLFSQFAFSAVTMFGCFGLAAALVVYSVMMDRRTDVARYNRLSAVAPVAEPETSSTSTAGDAAAG
ncbi:helix-turn-helix transcriptional regulator [Arabiibacter massiliensis]|uniref:helix-turn-helix transcriptional regulator n=1 Tax=Arabiibacter massiliensis TaxID=1870985 RepID=UPI0009BA7641|nr:helix-turn-helix transcriptional regulator [Arabiibacter massiliensis]